MIESLSPMWQGLLGTLFTWGVTAAGAGIVYITETCGGNDNQQKFLDASLGFAAGVMLAASYWSLLAPAIEMSDDYGSLAFLPASVGFVLGALVVYAGDVFLKFIGADADEVSSIRVAVGSGDNEGSNGGISPETPPRNKTGKDYEGATSSSPSGGLRKRGLIKERKKEKSLEEGIDDRAERSRRNKAEEKAKWRSMMLLVAAITIHNFPEGLAVGVGFGAIGKGRGATFAKARNLAVGIGLQNFPEGLAVSLPLRRIGFTKHKAFFWGQASGMVEPIGGLMGAIAVSVVVVSSSAMFVYEGEKGEGIAKGV